MQTWKEVFSREEERQNLKNIGFCLLVVLTLVVGAFALTSLQIFFEQSRNTAGEWAESTPSEWADEVRK
jgi:Tfp pilus assembly protein PilX